MFPRGEFRDDSAIFGVKRDLRGDDVGENPPLAHYGRAGFIARGFEREQCAHLAATALRDRLSDPGVCLRIRAMPFRRSMARSS